MIYVLSKLFTALLLPPGLFVLILAALTVRVRRYRILLASATALLYLLSVRPVGDWLLSQYEEPYRHTALPIRADAVVTLGGGNIQGNPLPLVDEAFKRHIYGLSIAKRMDIPVIVSGTGDEGYNEYLGLMDTLATLRLLLKEEDFVVSRSYVGHYAIIPETESADTYENARNSVRLVGKSDPALVVVTSAYHMKRALRLFRLAGVRRVYPAAVNFYTQPGLPFQWTDLFPSMSALQNSFRAIHEFFGGVKVSLREWMKRLQE